MSSIENAMKALVLAAGKGERIASVSGNKPKSLLEISGEAVLVHNLKLLAHHGVRDIWINLHQCADLIRKKIGDGKPWGVNVRYSYESELLGTAGALKKLEDQFCSGTFLVVYGDNFTDCDLGSLLKDHVRSDCLGTIAVFDRTINPNSGIAGGRISMTSEGDVESFVEGDDDPSQLVNAGIYAFNPGILSRIPSGFSDFGKDIFPGILKDGMKLKVYKMSGYCFGLDTPEAYATAQKHFTSLLKAS